MIKQLTTKTPRNTKFHQENKENQELNLVFLGDLVVRSLPLPLPLPLPFNRS
jgi:hypothetical protein